MSFNEVARQWDNNPMHFERSNAIADAIIQSGLLNKDMNALEFGAGTGILSMMLQQHVDTITLFDPAEEMVKVMQEKVKMNDLNDKLKPVFSVTDDELFDCIFTQMVLHHVDSVDETLEYFRDSIQEEGVLVIADLYTEDGSFHGPEAKVHYGFDPQILLDKLFDLGFTSAYHKKVFEIKRDNGNVYPVFILFAQL